MGLERIPWAVRALGNATSARICHFLPQHPTAVHHVCHFFIRRDGHHYSLAFYDCLTRIVSFHECWQLGQKRDTLDHSGHSDGVGILGVNKEA